MTDRKFDPTESAVARFANLHDKNIEPERWQAIFMRTVWGAIILLAGVALLVFMYVVFRETKELSLWLLGIGVILVAWGANTASNQILGGGLKSLASPVASVRRALGRDGGRDA